MFQNAFCLFSVPILIVYKLSPIHDNIKYQIYYNHREQRVLHAFRSMRRGGGWLLCGDNNLCTLCFTLSVVECDVDYCARLTTLCWEALSFVVSGPCTTKQSTPQKHEVWVYVSATELRTHIIYTNKG